MDRAESRSVALAQFLYWTTAVLYWVILAVAIGVAVIGVTFRNHPAALSLDCGSLNIEFFDPTRFALSHWTNLALLLMVLLLWMVILSCLRGILGEARRGNVFDARTPRRVRLIGVAVIASSVLEAIFAASWSSALSQALRSDAGVHITSRADTSQVFLGLVLFVLAEVFQRGVTLKSENDLTV